MNVLNIITNASFGTPALEWREFKKGLWRAQEWKRKWTLTGKPNLCGCSYTVIPDGRGQFTTWLAKEPKQAQCLGIFSNPQDAMRAGDADWESTS